MSSKRKNTIQKKRCLLYDQAVTYLQRMIACTGASASEQVLPEQKANGPSQNRKPSKSLPTSK